MEWLILAVLILVVLIGIVQSAVKGKKADNHHFDDDDRQGKDKNDDYPEFTNDDD